MSVDWRAHEDGASLVVELSGELDEGAAALLSPIDGEAAGVRTVVVDLRRVTFIDSAGLGALVALHHRLEGSGAVLRLVADDDTMARRLLAVTRLDQLLPVYSSIDGARLGTG